MNKQFKLKIIGGSPRSFLLAFILAKLKCDVYMYDFLRDSNYKGDDEIFFLSNYSKILLSKFDIWNEIEKISYKITSLSINDNLVSEKLLLRTENISKTFLNSIGWTVKYSDIKNFFINKLIKYENFHFLSKNQLIDKSLNFDYQFNFKNNDNLLNFFKLPISSFRREEEQILIFNVYLRGHVEKRLYEINTTKGFLVLTPLNNNLYQIVWNNPSPKIKERSANSKSFFLDNLTTLLPNEFKIDQIIGDINSIHFNKISPVILINNKSIYFNENKFKSNILYDFNFDFFLRYIYQIYYFLENNNNKKFFILYKFYYLLKNYMVLKITINFYCCLINLFLLNNKFLLIIRKLAFTFFNRINFLKIFIIRKLINSNINNLTK